MRVWLMFAVLLVSLSACGPGPDGPDGGSGFPPDSSSSSSSQSGACTGEARPCGSFVQAGCNAQDGCTWVGDLTSGNCTGVATACPSLTDADSCVIQEGCDWAD